MDFVQTSDDHTHYIIRGNVLFPIADICIDKPLIIKPEAVVSVLGNTQLFFSESSGMICYGRFKAQGEKDKKISFIPLNKNWRNLNFATHMASGSFLHYCNISGGMGIQDKLPNPNILPSLKLNNQDPYIGGGLMVSEANITIIGSDISNCSSHIGGGAYFFNSESHLISTNFSKNKSICGAGIYADNSSLKLSNLKIGDCSAEYGGGLALFRDKSILDSWCEFYRNLASQGGGIYIQDSETFLCNANLKENGQNKPEHLGGGIFIKNSRVDAAFCQILENLAEKGSNIYLANSQISWQGEQPPRDTIHKLNSKLLISKPNGL